jgi:hypothetical protein
MFKPTTTKLIMKKWMVIKLIMVKPTINMAKLAKE